MEKIKSIWQDMTKKQKIIWGFIGIVVVLGMISYLINPSEYHNKTTNNPAPSTVEKPATDAQKSTLKKGYSSTTNSGISYKITKATTLNLGVDGNRKETDFFNLETSIIKENDWHSQAKEIITDIVKKNNNKPTAISMTSSDGTEILNWNMQLTNVILYTYPVEANESETFEVK